MKNLLLSKTLAVCVSAMLIMCQSLIAVEQTGIKGQITAIYDYSKFGFSGTYNSIRNPTTESITRVYSNGSVTGHGGLTYSGGNPIVDNTIFIPQSLSYFNANGVVKYTQDLVTNTYQEFDVAGKIKTTYSKVEITDGNWVTYTANVVYATDGSYKIWRTGTMSDSNGNMIMDNPTTPHTFTTSREEYDSSGKLLKVWTYKLTDDESTTIEGGRTDYTYDGTYLTKEMTYEIVDFGTPEEKEYNTQITYYAENRRNMVKKLKTETINPTDADFYVSDKYIYDGAKLTKVQTYDETGKNTRNTLYDVFARKYKVEDPTPDAAGNPRTRVLQEFFYNDTVSEVTSKTYDESQIAKCVAGGLLKSIDYIYPETGTDYLSADVTYFKNGDENKRAFAIHIENPKGIAALNRAANYPADGMIFGSNNNVNGKLTVGENGLLTLALDTEVNFVNPAPPDQYGILNIIQKAIDEDEDFGNVADDTITRAYQLTLIRDALIEQWVASGGSTPTSELVFDATLGKDRKIWSAGDGHLAGDIALKIGTIDLTKVVYSPEPQNEVRYQAASNESLFSQMSNPALNDEILKLNCNYWAVDSSGNIWVFVNDATYANGAALPPL